MLNKSAVKYIQSLQHKKFRDQYHVFVAEGPKVVNELLQSAVFACEMICALPEWIETHQASVQHLAEGIVQVAEYFQLEKISSFATPNQVVAVFRQHEKQTEISTADQITLVLDHIQDPGNLGTIIRTADWFGIRQIVCSPDTADVYNHKVVQSTMASLARVRVHYTDLQPWLKSQAHVPIYAMMLNGKKIDEVVHKNPAVIIIGNEANGVSKELLLDNVQQITIPGSGETESLNAAVAASIVMYAFATR